MDFDEIILDLLNEITEGKQVDIDVYCEKYPQYKEAILAKFKTANFIKHHFQEEDYSNKKLGEYILLQELGRGGMGIVFLAIQPALSRLSAIKVLPPNFSFDKEALNNFIEEAKTIAQFNHPNIVPIFSVGEESGIYYIAMAYIPGLSLRNIIDMLKKNKGKIHNIKAVEIRNLLQEPISNKQEVTDKSITLRRNMAFWDLNYFHFIASMISEVADAIHYAHENKIVHGDLKPSNILLTREAIPMVVDFGLSAKPGKGAPKNEFSGTIMYAAPEQLKNNVIDDKTDMWSLGVTLYELLCFRNPFTADTLQKTSDNILKGYPVSPRTYNKKIPHELEAIVLKCLENNPENRYATMGELSADLKNYLELKPIKAKRDNIFRRIKKAIIRKPMIAALVVLLIIISIFTITYAPYYLTEKWRTDIDSLLNSKNISGALIKYRRLNSLGKFYPLSQRKVLNGHIMIANYYLGTSDYGKANYYFQKVINEDPTNIHGWTWLAQKGMGVVFQVQGMNKEARKIFIDCYKYGGKEDPDIGFSIAQTYYADGYRKYNLKRIVLELKKEGYSQSQIQDIAESFLIIDAYASELFKGNLYGDRYGPLSEKLIKTRSFAGKRNTVDTLIQSVENERNTYFDKDREFSYVLPTNWHTKDDYRDEHAIALGPYNGTFSPVIIVGHIYFSGTLESYINSYLSKETASITKAKFVREDKQRGYKVFHTRQSTLGSKPMLKNTIYFFEGSNNKMFSILCVGLLEDKSINDPIFDQVAKSFRIY